MADNGGDGDVFPCPIECGAGPFSTENGAVMHAVNKADSEHSGVQTKPDAYSLLSDLSVVGDGVENQDTAVDSGGSDGDMSSGGSSGSGDSGGSRLTSTADNPLVSGPESSEPSRPIDSGDDSDSDDSASDDSDDSASDSPDDSPDGNSGSSSGLSGLVAVGALAGLAGVVIRRRSESNSGRSQTEIEVV